MNAAVAAIIARVRAEGDAALIELTRAVRRSRSAQGRPQGDGEPRSTRRAARSSRRRCEALELAHDRILDHHKRQLPKNDLYRDRLGVELGTRWTAVASAGLYVPGGTASYPSSVLMNAVPAKVAGVPRIVMVVPARKVRSIRWCWWRPSSPA